MIAALTNAAAGVLQRVELIAGARVKEFRPATRGYTAAVRGVVELCDGSRTFLKAASDEQTAHWLRDEHRMYAGLSGSFMPKLLGWQDADGVPLMLLEDLSAATWPPPWTSRMVSQVQEMLAEVQAAKPPAGLPTLESMRGELCSWKGVAADPSNFLSLGLCSRHWLEKSLPCLIAADERATLAGEQLLHFDVRSSNVCFRNGAPLLIDWNWACIGNGALELIHWLPNLRVDGGEVPEGITRQQPELVSMMTGYWAFRAGMPEPRPDSTLRKVQLAQLREVLPWCIEALELSPV